MDTTLKYAPAIEVRALIARLLIPKIESGQTIGEIDLRPHQTEGVSRILRAIDEFGGALLCDVVGLGKTFTAAAVMRHFSSAAVIAPAALREMWEDSLRRAGSPATVLSLERFSYPHAADPAAQLVVIDEAHHLRNTRTRRFRNISTFAEHSRLLLLSATPIHNRAEDITALLSLFLGARADSLTAAEIAGCVIRRQRSGAAGTRFPVRNSVPAVNAPVSLAVRRRLLSLPSPIPPRDGGECAALVQLTLLRQWVSSDAALRAGLELRIARAAALISSLEAGTYPTRKELWTWSTTGLEVQLGFAELLAAPGGDHQLIETMRDHTAATRATLEVLNAGPSSDRWRADYLRAVRTRYPDRKVVAFTQFAVTARELYRFLRNDSKVAVITSSRCEIASGCVTRRDVIERFAPLGSGALPPAEREEISMLLATDLCSEGLNLQDAGVIVHLDMPWTPARVEQRIGRIARPGSQHREIFIHTVSVPEVSEDLLRIEQRLRAKTLISTRAVGSDEECIQGEAGETSPAESAEQILAILKSWECGSAVTNRDCQMAFCDVAHANQCFISVVEIDGQAELICGDSDCVTRDPQKLLAVLSELTATDVPGDPDMARATTTRILDWLAQNRLAITLGAGRMSSVARTVARRISSAAHAAPIHSRSRVAAAADRARDVLSAPRSAGLEMKLSGLTHDSGPDEQWLGRLESLEHDLRKRETGSFDESGFELRAVLIGRMKNSG